MKAPASSERSLESSVHILLIDDNKLGMAARKAVLEELGYQIATATSGQEGLKHLAERRFHLVVTDYKMPRMNGVQLIEQIRKTHPETSIILLTGFADALGLDEKTTGADVVIQKSANEVVHMVRAVRRLLRPARKAASSERRSGGKSRRATG